MEPNVLDWYLGLQSRTLDLVGDYAGNELFVLEGDSLLLYCFGDLKIDFEDGFQLLHAVYAVEHFLEALVRRMCNFHIVFFSDHEDLCIPPQIFPRKNLYMLARSVIIRHLKSHLPESHPEIKVLNFSSVHEALFQEFLESSGVYFIMCHDGAHAHVKSKVNNSASSTCNGDWQRLAFRRMIGRFISLGFNVALINGLEIRDTKVMAMIVEGKPGNSTMASSTKYPVMSGKPSVLPEEILETGMKDMSLDTLPDRLDAFLKDFKTPPTSPPNHGLGTMSNGSAAAPMSSSERLILIIFTLSELLVQHPAGGFMVSAFLLHAILLSHIAFAARRLKQVKFPKSSEAQGDRIFINDFAIIARGVIDCDRWQSYCSGSRLQCDLADLVDGRLFKAVLFAIRDRSEASKLLPRIVMDEFDYAAATIKSLSGIHLQFSSEYGIAGKIIVPPPEQNDALSILPFSNSVFDQHLTSIKIEVDIQDIANPNKKSIRIFKEISHWHNRKKPIDKMKIVKIRNDKAGQRLLKSNQRYMDEMLKYAASLTNATGKILDPQTITVQKSTKPSSSSVIPSIKKSDGSSDVKRNKQGKSKAVPTAKELAQASIDSKRTMLAEKTFSSWGNVRERLDKMEAEKRYEEARSYYQNLAIEKQEVLNAEITLYSLQPLLEIWSKYCKEERKEEGYKVVALLWSHIKDLWKLKHSLTRTIVTHAMEVWRHLGFHTNNEIPTIDVDRPLTFTFRIPSSSSYTLSIGLSPQQFQLLYCGPYMDRNIDSQPDARVPFNPDGWQRAVLDEIDADHSVFVVAPTSAGKTFISFYAMEKILRADDDGVLVYVAPTKALVNQIGAEIQARFSKAFKYGGKSVWAIHTRDYRVNNPTGCQILVTVPHILQIMLLAPSNAKSWAPRVKRIIFDEIHSIGQAEDGVVWEQLLLLAPCPIIALSATVGNPEQFSDWLTASQRSSGFELSMIQHQTRYSDLRKFMYTPPKVFKFGGLSRTSTLGDVGLDGIPGFQFFHPAASLVNRSRGMPADLSLEARDCLILWQTMSKHQTASYPVPEELSPKESCPATVAKIDIARWENALKKLLSLWMLDSGSPFGKVFQDIYQPLATPSLIETRGQHTDYTDDTAEEVDSNKLSETALPLLNDLHERNALPAIMFNFDRSRCESIAKAVLHRLERAETSWKETNKGWKAKMEDYEKWKATKTSKASKDVKPKKNKDGDGERLSKADAQKDSAEREVSIFETFDPSAPCKEFSFADLTKVEKSEMADYFKKLEWKGVATWLMTALTRGIGIHHAGMNRKYRQTVEILFRKGYLRVVIATGTLALGINMPCKTVVFSGDSVYLTALNFRQCAGRAGRRGFDILGNVVFHGISLDKACRLVSSRLPDLNGHFPITTTLVLRLFTLLHESDNSAYARRAINSLLSQPRLYLGGESFKAQVLHHLRFSIEYLRREQLLGLGGEPINFTGAVSHLYFTENSSFAFHALLKGGYFHTLCADIHKKSQATLRKLMLVMAHLFGRRPCRQSDAEYIEKIVKRSSSIVFLPELPKEARKILQNHNQATLETFTTYVKTFAKQHVVGDDRVLPLTGLSVGGNDPTPIEALHPLPPTTARSHFVALSGHSDTFTSIDDLCSSTRSEIFLEKAVIPHLDIPSATPLNAYLYDYFMHGAVQPLETANGIKKGDIWFLLNDFSMVLATITTSLANFLKVEPIDDGEMLDIVGQGDAMEENMDAEEESDAPAQRAAKSEKPKAALPTPSSSHKAKKVVLDSWEDEPEVPVAKEGGSYDLGEDDDDSSASDGASSEEGLMDVLTAFQMLKAEFDEKFKAMWA
ncbi:hypothetical protein MMC13_004330 [Lambiella insularis]|nr:hypothetical protein [Lambiella insularis]